MQMRVMGLILNASLSLLRRAILPIPNQLTSVITVTVTVTVILFKCQKNKRTHELPLDIRLSRLHLGLPYMQNVLAHGMPPRSEISFQRFLVPVYYWKTVEIMITDVNYCGIGSTLDTFQNHWQIRGRKWRHSTGPDFDGKHSSPTKSHTFQNQMSSGSGHTFHTFTLIYFKQAKPT